MRRFSLWLRDKPVVADSALAVALLLFDLAGVGEARHAVGYLVLSVLLPLPLVLRRVYPREMAVTLLALSVLATTIGHLLDDNAVHPALLGLGIMLYTLVAYVGRREALWFMAGLVVDHVYSVVAVTGFARDELAFVALYFALCWTLAEFNGARHAYDSEVAARLAVADYDRERSAHEAVSAERTRIARELHDVVAHGVSVMIVQADGARYALRRDPDVAEQALTTIASSGREALHELRRTVALLRTEDADEQFPQHGTAGLANVAHMMRATGLAVDLELSGELDGIASEISLGIHRIVQESLTNTLRHAGAHPKAWVRVHRHGDEVHIEVIDSGGVPVREPDHRIQGSGLGVAGMRERVAVLGGTIEAGRTEEGAWRVFAAIPLTRASQE